MCRIISVGGTSGDSYIIPPKDNVFLYAIFNNDNSFRLKNNLEFRIELIASKGVKVNKYLKDMYEVSDGGVALFRVSPNFYRGTVNPDNIQRYSQGLEEYIKEEENIDISDEAVTTVAQEIINQLPPKKRENPYAIMDEIMHWIEDNVEYTLIASHVIDEVKQTIEELPEEQRYEPLIILRNAFNIKAKYLRNVVNLIHLPRNIKDSRKLAKELMEQAGNVWKLFQFCWLKENSASAVL